jgi:hypothetical protein
LALGWFPGAQPQFTQAEMQSKAAYKGGSIVGLQATRKVVTRWRPSEPMS